MGVFERDGNDLSKGTNIASSLKNFFSVFTSIVYVFRVRMEDIILERLTVLPCLERARLLLFSFCNLIRAEGSNTIHEMGLTGIICTLFVGTHSKAKYIACVGDTETQQERNEDLVITTQSTVLVSSATPR
jgi:hypothetical protein